MPNYENLQLRKKTRKMENAICCYVYLTARYMGHLNVQKGKGYRTKLENHIGTSNGLYGSSNIEKQPSTSV